MIRWSQSYDASWKYDSYYLQTVVAKMLLSSTVNTRTTSQMRKRAIWKEFVLYQNHSITITSILTVSYIVASLSMLNLNCRCSIWEWKMSMRRSRMFLLTSWLARSKCWSTEQMFYVCCGLNHSDFIWFLLFYFLNEWFWT